VEGGTLVEKHVSPQVDIKKQQPISVAKTVAYVGSYENNTKAIQKV
jgi:hypothetical protein